MKPLPLKKITSITEQQASSESPRGLVIPDELARDAGLIRAVVDPYVNAIHLGLLRAKDDLPLEKETHLENLRSKLLREGPQALSVRDQVALLSDADSMIALHEQLWLRHSDELAPAWKQVLELYSPAGLTSSLGRAA